MLNEKFLARLDAAFPSFYVRVNEEAMQEARRLREAAGGDPDLALTKARLRGALRVWGPYLKGSIPFIHRDRAAMEAFTHLVLTVDHIVGFVPPSEDAARRQVGEVLRSSIDIERLKRLMDRDKVKSEAAGAAAATGMLASAGAFLSPLTAVKQLRRGWRFVPAPVRVAAGVVVAGALASIPLVAGYSAGLQAEKAARNFGELAQPAGTMGENGKESRRTNAAVHVPDSP